VLVALLLVTGQSMAVARGAAGPAGELVLCTGSGPVVILVDEDGAPVAPPHYCPDCVLSFLDHVAVDHVMVAQSLTRVARLWASGTGRVAGHGPLVLRARAPPMFV